MGITEKYQFPDDQMALMEAMRVPFAVYQFVGKRVVTLVLSQGFLDLFGYTDRALAYYEMDNDMYAETHPDDIARIADEAFRFATEGGTYEVVYRTRDKKGSGYRVVHAKGEHVLTDTGVRLAHVWYTDEGMYHENARSGEWGLNSALSGELHDESLVRASHYDQLTGLPNMTFFFELAEAACDAIKERGGKPALLYMDMSGMKYFNSRNGFSEGNDLLRAFSRVLAATFSSEGCCHISGDHFAAFSEEDGLEDLLEQFFKDCSEMNGGKNLPVRVGIYLESMESVRVGVACDRAKFAVESLRNVLESSYSYYDLGLRKEEDRRQYVLENFDRAIEERWIQVYYQPIVRAVNGRVCDEEALARWVDPERGLLSPVDFIPALEESGMIYKLDLYVLDRVIEKIKYQIEEGFDIVPHSINLSRSDFDACDIVEEIRQRVDVARLARDLITIEITESTVGANQDFVKKQVERFQDLGFPVWMDDFGSGYSSLDVLQSIKFNLIKFDMSFMQKLDESEGSKIVLTELMKMATALGVDTVCEGVETESQARFLQEIGCSKLQGYYYKKPIPLEEILERYAKGIQIGYENPEESAYFEAIGRVNLYDLAVIAGQGDEGLQNFFSTLPMGIVEMKGNDARFVRANQSYRDFMERFFGLDLSDPNHGVSTPRFGASSSFMKLCRQCCESGARVFYDERMPDGSTVHSFIRRIGVNPVTGDTALVLAVLSIEDANEGMTYASIARALAADYYNLYYVDIETEQFIEYSSPVGGEELAMERRGADFFAASRKDAMERIYEGDRGAFAAAFTKENVLTELDKQGTFTITYRLIERGEPVYANMKVMRMQPDGRHLIVGVSIVDSQMKQKAELDRIRREREMLAGVMALSGEYMALYIVDLESGRYIEHSATSQYDSLDIAKQGSDFFAQSIVNIEKVIVPDDLQGFRERFSKESVMREIEENGTFQMRYRLVVNGEPQPVVLKMARIRESDGDRLIAGVRAWRDRK